MEHIYDCKMPETRTIRLPPERGQIKARIYGAVKKVVSLKRITSNIIEAGAAGNRNPASSSSTTPSDACHYHI